MPCRSCRGSRHSALHGLVTRYIGKDKTMMKKIVLLILLAGSVFVMTGCGKEDYGNIASVTISSDSDEIPQLPFLDGVYPFKWQESIANMEKILNCKLEKKGEFYYPANDSGKKKGYYFDSDGQLLAVIVNGVPQADLEKLGRALEEKYNAKPRNDFYYVMIGKGKVKFSLEDEDRCILVEKVD